MSEAEGHKLYAVTANWNRLRSHLYTMAKEDEDSEMDLHHIAEITWEDRYLSQITELHVVAALLVPQNHNIQVIGVSTSQAFFSIMHRFFAEYLNVEEAKAFFSKSRRRFLSCLRMLDISNGFGAVLEPFQKLCF